MSKHDNGHSYPRQKKDLYPTPAWVVAALVEHVDVKGLHILEPAAGTGSMAEALKAAGATVYATDIADRGYRHLNGIADFTRLNGSEFAFDARKSNGISATITNPPLGYRGRLGVAFIETGLARMSDGWLALLLPVDFDSAKTRRGLFDLCPKFEGKVVLVRRIKWFDTPGKGKSPKENHAWFLWGHVPWRMRSARTIRYSPQG